MSPRTSAPSVRDVAAGAPVVIVGAGLAGAAAAIALRESGHRGPVTLIGNEPEPPYERPPLSKGYLTGQAGRESIYVRPRAWYTEHGIDLRLDSTVSAISRDTHRIRLQDGSSLAYSKLLLATGSAPRQLAVPGSELDGVLTLRRLPDSDRLREILHRGGPLVVVGGGWIGLEVAAAARQADVPVTVLESTELPLLRVLGPEMAPVFAAAHRAHGVDLRTCLRVAEITGRRGAATGVRLGDGTLVPADAVLVAVGAVAAIDLASTAGLAVDDGVLVDEHLTTSDSDIYAAGDIANAYHPRLGRRLRVEHWANALNQAAVAAAGMLGEQVVYDRSPYFYTDQYDIGMEYTGFAPEGSYDDVVVRGDVGDLKFIAFWLRKNRVLAAMHVNDWDDAEAMQRLVATTATVDPVRLADPATDLPDLVSASS